MFYDEGVSGGIGAEQVKCLQALADVAVKLTSRTQNRLGIRRVSDASKPEFLG